MLRQGVTAGATGGTGKKRSGSNASAAPVGWPAPAALTGRRRSASLSLLPAAIVPKKVRPLSQPAFQARPRSPMASTSAVVAGSKKNKSRRTNAAATARKPVASLQIRPTTSAVAATKARSALASFPAYANPFQTAHSLPTPLPTPVTSSRSSPAPTVPVAGSKKSASFLLARELRDVSAASSKSLELAVLKNSYALAKGHGGATYLALDVETWEREHGCLLEFGWSFVRFEQGAEGVERGQEDQHVENARRRNGKFSPDARDLFDFGTTVHLSQARLLSTLSALFSTLSDQGPLFLIFHDARSDLKSLATLGFSPQELIGRVLNLTKPQLASFLPSQNSPGDQVGPGVFVIDTQSLFSAHVGERGQRGLGYCMERMGVKLKFRPHNAGNDARGTLELFLALMKA